jgi:hypothetical protein
MIDFGALMKLAGNEVLLDLADPESPQNGATIRGVFVAFALDGRDLRITIGEARALGEGEST